MTISYNYDIASTGPLAFLKILIRWKGSVWKSVINELFLWLILYYMVLATYRFILKEEQQKLFAHFAVYCEGKMDYIPLNFMLGFFVTQVLNRWKNFFENIGFIDNVAFYINGYIRGADEETRTIRRNLIRYLCLTQVLVLRDISVTVRNRFPNIESLVDAGYLQKHESELFLNVKNEENVYSNYWIPINWVFSACSELRQELKIKADVFLNGLLGEVRAFRTNLQMICNYDWVPIPLAYPQVVFLAVRVYFLLCLVSRQTVFDKHLEPPKRYLEVNNVLIQNISTTTDEAEVKFDIFLPFMTILQFIFYMGWLKVAEALLNPLGEDDDDFELNYIIDRNIRVGMSIVDEGHGIFPRQLPDKFQFENELLYSEETANIPINSLMGSVAQAADKKTINANTTEEIEHHVKMVPHTKIATNELGGSIFNLSDIGKQIGKGRNGSSNATPLRRRLSLRLFHGIQRSHSNVPNQHYFPENIEKSIESNNNSPSLENGKAKFPSSLPTSPTDDTRLTNLATYLDTVLEAEDNELSLRSKKSIQ